MKRIGGACLVGSKYEACFACEASHFESGKGRSDHVYYQQDYDASRTSYTTTAITGIACAGVVRSLLVSRALERLWYPGYQQERGDSSSALATGAGAHCPVTHHLHDRACRAEASLSLCHIQRRLDGASRGC